jgi:hypothetical protein
MRRMALFAAMLAAVSLGVVVGVGGVAGADETAKGGSHVRGDHGHGLLGTWLVDVSPTGDQPFQAMLTLSPGGGVIETESTGPGTSQGSWEPREGGGVALTFQRFEFDEQGQPAGHVVVRAELNPAGRGELSGPFAFDVFDPQGNVVFSGTGTATARRFEVQPL